MKSGRRAVLFDFDGTLADSLTLFIDALQQVTRREHPLSAADIAQLRQLSTRQAMRALGIRPWQLPSLVSEGRKVLAHRIDEVGLFAGIHRLVDFIQGSAELYVVSSNSKANVDAVLQREGLLPAFVATYGGVGVFDKARALRTVLKTHDLTVEQATYVGDEVRDIQAARRLSLVCVSVTWGYHARERLIDYHPDWLADTPTDLEKILHKLTRDTKGDRG